MCAYFPILFRNVKDYRAKGLSLGLAAHVFGNVEEWQISHTAVHCSAFGLAVNGLLIARYLSVISVFNWDKLFIFNGFYKAPIAKIKFFNIRL
ncbi:LrgB family protein [Psychrobacter sp. 16-MNA-CIBAN-0192]|uniref:LrgB family protein n=1 Tax=Psychrobacter sp. 16-MNA-CIBAN-0192 TaxID=3140448 RepID=UPI0033299663